MYSEVDRRRGKLKKDETDALQEQVRHLESIVAMLTVGPDDAAHDLLNIMRENAPPRGPPGSFPAADILSEWQRSRQRDAEFNPDVRLWSEGNSLLGLDLVTDSR
jgi:hypothetical protein